MRLVIYTLATLLLALYTLPGNAQISSGTIDYLETYTFPMWEGMSNDMKKRIEEARSRGDFDRIGRLSFNDEAFTYSQLPPEEKPAGSRGGGWMARRSENPDVFYTQMSDSMVFESRRIMDRSFLMEAEWLIPDWEVPPNQRPNMAYTLPSEVAYAETIDGDTLTAYFTRSIPLGIGPRGYGGLPGAIVYLKVQKGESYAEYTMQTMQPNPAELVIERPTEGKSISREEFLELRKKREEARERQIRSWRRGRGR